MSKIAKVEIPLHVGDTAEFTKTVTETDVYLFGGITADYSQMHFNEEYMKKQCMEHGLSMEFLHLLLAVRHLRKYRNR